MEDQEGVDHEFLVHGSQFSYELQGTISRSPETPGQVNFDVVSSGPIPAFQIALQRGATQADLYTSVLDRFGIQADRLTVC